MKEYRVVQACTIWELIRAVNEVIQSGWEPLGPPIYAQTGEFVWHQAMVRG